MTHKLLQWFPSVNAAYRAYRESKRLRRPPMRTPMGFWLAGNSAMQRGEFEVAETKLVQSLLDEVDVLINVGANIGYYCSIALGMDKKVVAVEPLPSNLAMLMRNMAANGWENKVEIFPMAMGDSVGTITIFGAGTGASLVKGWAGQSDDECVSVPISTLDLILGSRFPGQRSLILVDVEGAELGMLRGASKLLQADPKPIWMTEIAVGEHQPSGTAINPNLLETFEIFDSAGYLATTADERHRVVEIQEVAKIVETGVDTLGTHNFVFRHPTFK